MSTTAIDPEPSHSKQTRVETPVTTKNLAPNVGFMDPSRAASCTAHTTVAVTLWWVPELSGMHPSQDTLDKASASMLAFPVQ